MSRRRALALTISLLTTLTGLVITGVALCRIRIERIHGLRGMAGCARALSASDPLVRELAVERLNQDLDEMRRDLLRLPPRVAAAPSETQPVSRAAVQRAELVAAAPVLANALAGEDDAVRTVALDALRETGRDGVCALAAALRAHPNALARRRLMQALLGLRGQAFNIVDALIATAVQDGDGLVRQGAITLLCHIAEVPVESLHDHPAGRFADAFLDPEPVTQTAAINLAARLGDPGLDLLQGHAKEIVPVLLTRMTDRNDLPEGPAGDLLLRLVVHPELAPLVADFVGVEQPAPIRANALRVLLHAAAPTLLLSERLRCDPRGKDPQVEALILRVLRRLAPYPAPILENLLAALGSPTPAIRVQAAVACAEPTLDLRALPLLLDRLADPDPDVRTAVARALRNTGPDKRVLTQARWRLPEPPGAGLPTLVTDATADGALSLAQVVALHRAELFDAVRKTDTPEARVTALRLLALGDIHDLDLVLEAAALMRETSVSAREAALRYFKDLGPLPPERCAELITVAQGEREAASVAALAALDLQPHQPELRALALDLLNRTPSVGTRIAAIRLAGHQGDAGDMDVLTALAHQANGEDAEARTAATQALVELGPEVVKPLRELESRDRGLRRDRLAPVFEYFNKARR